MRGGRLGTRRSGRRQEGVRLLLLAVWFALPSLAPALARAQQADSIRITWTAPADNPGPSAVARYDIRLSIVPLTDANFLNATPLVSGTPRNPGARETLVVRNLAVGRTYWLAIRSADRAGNWSAMSNVLQWPAALDASPPPTPTNAVADLDPSGTEVQLTWNPSSAPDLAGYDVYRTADPAKGWQELTAAPVTGTSWIDTQPPSGFPRLYYAVTAKDLTGNESARSASAVVVFSDARAAGTAWRLLPAYPNPARVGAVQHLPIESPIAGGLGRVEILDAAGQLVRSFDAQGGSLPAAELDWDGRNDHGVPCAPGVYTARLTAGSVRQVIRIARVP